MMCAEAKPFKLELNNVQLSSHLYFERSSKTTPSYVIDLSPIFTICTP